MVIIDFSVEMDETLVESDSIISVFADDKILCELSYNNRFFYCQMKFNNEIIVVKRKYLKSISEKSGWLKKFVSSLVTFIIISLSNIESFECPFECEERFEIQLTDDFPQINIICMQLSSDKTPKFEVKSKGCNIRTQKKLWISSTELKDMYVERKKMFLFPFGISSFTYLCIILLAIIFGNFTTILFSTLIFIIILGCLFYSYRNIKKEYKELKNKSEHKNP